VVSKAWITLAGKAPADSESGAADIGCAHFRKAGNTAPGRQAGL
jgi:hypothetical protein